MEYGESAHKIQLLGCLLVVTESSLDLSEGSTDSKNKCFAKQVQLPPERRDKKKSATTENAKNAKMRKHASELENRVNYEVDTEIRIVSSDSKLVNHFISGGSR
jgi:hypothetical protein